MQVSKVAMAVSLALVGLAAGAEAQIPAPLSVRAIGLASEERGPIAALQAATGSQDRAAQDRALAAARAAVRTPQGRYAVGYFQLELGRIRSDEAMRNQAIDLIVESGQATPEEMGSLLANQASRALVAGDMRRTDRLLTQIVELQPANFAAMADQAELKARLGERGNAVILLHRAVMGAQAAGRPAPESWHLRGLALAFDARMAPQGVALGQALVANYPSAVNWRDALLAYRELAAPDPILALDIQRLMRVTQGLGGERDYFEHAEALRAQQLILEAKAVLDDGVQRGMVEMSRVPPPLATAVAARAIAAERARLPGLRTAALAAATGQPARVAGDAHYGQGQYAEAAELYRAALQKGGEDSNLVNSRLGAALAMAGRRPEAEAAFRAVTGPRADLAGFWLAWLARRPA